MTANVTSLGGLTLGSGDALTINSGISLTTNAVSVTGGTIFGPGTLSTTGTSNSLNGGTLSGLTISGAGGVWNLAGDSTLTGAINFGTSTLVSSQTFNTNAFTLNLDTATLTRTTTSTASFNIASGGTLNNKNNASSITTAGTVTMSGGKITNTSGSSGTTAGLFTIADPITGYGAISGNTALTGASVAASGGVAGTPQTLTIDGGSGASGIVLGSGLAVTTAGANNTLDLKGTIGVPGSMTMNPTASGLIKLDGANFSATSGTGAINTSSTVTAGAFDVVGAGATFNNVAFSAGTAATFSIDAPLTIGTGSSVGAKNVSLNGQAVTGPGSLNATSTITSTGASTLGGPFSGNLNVSSGSLDIKGAGTSTGTSTVSSTLNIDVGGSWTSGTVTNGSTINVNGGSWSSGNVTNNGTVNLDSGGKWTLPNSLSALTNNGTVNLNGGTLQGPTGFFNTAYIRNNSLTVAADSTLAGNFTWGTYFTIDTGAHTLNLDTSILSTVTGGAPPFTIDAGGALNNANGASSMGGGGTVTLNGGSITTTGGSLKIGDPISGYGSVSGNVDIAGSVTAAGAGKTLTVDGGSGSGLQLGNSSGSGASMSTTGGATLDLKGNLSLIEPATANPGTGTIQFDGAHFTNAFSSSPVSINNSGLVTAGTFEVTNDSSLANVAFSTGNGAKLKVDAGLSIDATSSVNATSVLMNGGSITGAGSLSTISGNISGFGLLSVPIVPDVVASGGTLTIDGGTGAGIALGTSVVTPSFSTAGGGNVLDLKGNLNVPSGVNMNPSGGVVQFDAANISHTGASPASINGSSPTTSGTFDVTNASTLSNVAFSTGNGANLKVDAPLTVKNGATVNATNTTVSGTGALNLVNTTGTTALTTHDLTLAQGSTLVTGGTGNTGHNGITLTGSFSYQQTDTIHGWTNGGVAGLGPDLVMNGGTAANPTYIEAGSVNLGNAPNAMVDNFALNSLTLGPNSYVKLVDNYQNATVSGWTPGSEVLYVGALFDAPGTPTLDLNGIILYVDGQFLNNGMYTTPGGGTIDVIGQNPVPEPAALLLFGSGLAGLALVRRRRA